MPSSITRLTSLDHQRLLRLLRRAVTEGPSQERWRDELVRLLAAHRVAEDRTLTADVVAPAGEAATEATEAWRGSTPTSTGSPRSSAPARCRPPTWRTWATGCGC